MLRICNRRASGERSSRLCSFLREFQERSSAATRPGTVVRLFLRQLDLGKVRDVVAMLPERIVNTVGAAKLESIFFDNLAELRAKGGILHLEVMGERVEGRSAEVDVSMRYGDGTSEVERIALVKERDEWKVDMSR